MPWKQDEKEERGEETNKVDDSFILLLIRKSEKEEENNKSDESFLGGAMKPIPCTRRVFIASEPEREQSIHIGTESWIGKNKKNRRVSPTNPQRKLERLQLFSFDGRVKIKKTNNEAE